MTTPILPDELIATIASSASRIGDTQSVGRIAVLARRFPPLILPILYRRITIEEHNFDRLGAALLPQDTNEPDDMVAAKAILRARVMAVDFKELPKDRDTRAWCSALQWCFHHIDVITVSEAALAALAGNEPCHTIVNRHTIFPNLTTVTVAPEFLETLTMTILARATNVDGYPDLHISALFAGILTYGAINLALSINLEWDMTRDRFIQEIVSRIHDGNGWINTARPEAEAIQLFMNHNIVETRSNIGLNYLFAYQKHIHRIDFHSVWYNTVLPLKLRADFITLEFADYAGFALADDHQPRPLCFSRMAEFHTALTKKIDWTIHNLASTTEWSIMEDQELGKVKGFIDELIFYRGRDPICVWDHLLE